MMRKAIPIIILLICFFLTGKSQEIKITGIYNGEALIVNNPFGPTGVDFCVYDVKVNGKNASANVNSNTFEINFTKYGIETGDNISITLKHKSGCVPEIINPEVVKPKSTYKLVNIKIDRENSKLTWVTKGERGELPFVVQQYRWKKWIPVKKVMGKGTSGKHKYTVDVPIHSGKNKFRIKQTDYTGKPNYSKELTFRSVKQPVKFEKKWFKGEIQFSAETKYEIFDSYGKKITAGYGSKIDLSDLENGTYYMNFDNKTVEFEK